MAFPLDDTSAELDFPNPAECVNTWRSPEPPDTKNKELSFNIKQSASVFMTPQTDREVFEKLRSLIEFGVIALKDGGCAKTE